MLPPALLPPFLASYGVRLLAAFSTFRFCASGDASGSGSLVFLRYPRYPRSGFLLLVVLLEACSALSALSAFRFSASGRASGSVFRVLRVICVPERYGVLLSLCAFS